MSNYTEDLDKTIFSVSIPKNNINLEYYLPQHLAKELTSIELWVGRRVFVSLSGRLVIGVILEVNVQSKISTSKLHPILYLIDKNRFLNDFFWVKLKWVSKYYCCHINIIINKVLPSELLKIKKTKNNLVQIKSFSDKSHDKYTFKISKFSYEKGYIELISEKISQYKNNIIYPMQNDLIKNSNSLEMNKEQIAIYDDYIYRIFNYNDIETSVLYGIPASGKTRLYLNLVKSIYIKNKLPILILVPEVSLINNIAKQVEESLGLNCIVYHGLLSEREKFYIWNNILENNVQIICSTRSGVWLPFNKLGGIVVDEEHDTSYKNNYGTIRENARDIAIWLGKRNHCFVLLCSSTPSLETIHNIKLGRYKQYKLLNKASNNDTDRSRVIFNKNRFISKNYIHVKNKEGEIIDISYKTAIQKILDSNRYVLIIINRRGFAEKLFCKECKKVLKCKKCNIPFVVFQGNILRIKCIVCNIFSIIPDFCPLCLSLSWVFIGIGIEKLNIIMKKEFPNYEIICFDDNLSHKKFLIDEKLDNFFKNNRPGILIGTQMLSKGHDFKDIGLSILLNIDKSFFSQDLRANERFCQLYTHVLGRTARNGSNSCIIVETQFEGHPLLSALKDNGYIESVEYILNERKFAETFPWKRLVYIWGYSLNSLLCKETLERIRVFIENYIKNNTLINVNIFFLGPYEVEKYKKFNKNSFLLEITGSYNDISVVKQIIYKNLNNLIYNRKVSILIDVDP